MLIKLLGIPENASEHGFQIDQMMEFVHWIMLVLFIGWSIFFITCLVKFRRKRNPVADYHGVRSKAATHVEFMVVMIEAVFLLGFGIPIWAKRVNGVRPEKDVLRISVISQQFSWNFHYPGADGVPGPRRAELVSQSNPIGLDYSDPASNDDIVVFNEVHLPLNKDVIIDISSLDVIHSFAVPNMRIGQDATPGSITPIWFKPIRTGSFEIICGQLCGTNHYNMKGTIVVESQEDFDAWQKEMLDLRAVPTSKSETAPTDKASLLEGGSPLAIANENSSL